MIVQIVLTYGKVIELEQINFLENMEFVKEQLTEILNNDCKFLYFKGSTFNKDLHINKQLIESINILESSK